MEAWFTVEGEAFVRINQDGRRDSVRTREKPAGVRRIAVLGDSFAEALQVDEAKTFWSILEREWNSANPAGPRVEVLNFGVSGFSTAQELEMLRHHVWDYDPDVVLVLLFPGNDLRENSKELSPDGVRPYYSVRDGQLLMDDSFRQHPHYRDAQSSFSRFKVACINRLRVLQVARQWWARRRATRPVVDARQQLEAGLDPIYGEPDDQVWRAAWDVTERLLAAMRNECESRRVDFWLASASTGLQVHLDEAQRDAALERLGGSDLFYLEQRLGEFCAREKIRYVPLAPAMQREAVRTRQYFHGFANSAIGVGHWNEAGHAVAGSLLAQALLESPR